MKHTNPKRAMPRWLMAMLLQGIGTLAIDLLLGLSLWIGGILHGLCIWVLIPVCGLFSACLATKAGFLNYFAFLVPPLCFAASNLILWGYLPPIAPVCLCAFVSLVGAAAGEVIKRGQKQQRSKSWKKI